MSLVKSSIPACVAALWLCLPPARGLAGPRASVTWTFDRLDRIGGHPTTVEGNPKVIATPIGKAVQFDGVDDALFIDNHPLAGARTFTFEAIFRPDGGDVEQRWFHLAERDPKTGQVTHVDPTTRADTSARFLFELRVVGSEWYLDAFVNGPGYSRALMFQDRRYPLGRWYHVAQVYDGTEYPELRERRAPGESGASLQTPGTRKRSRRRAAQSRELFQGGRASGAVHAPCADPRRVREGTRAVSGDPRQAALVVATSGGAYSGELLAFRLPNERMELNLRRYHMRRGIVLGA